MRIPWRNSWDPQRLHQQPTILLLTTTIYFIMMNIPGSQSTSELTPIFHNVAIPDALVTHNFTDVVGKECMCRERCRALMTCKALTIHNRDDGFVTCTLTTNDLVLLDCRRDDLATTIFKDYSSRKDFTYVPGVGYLHFNADSSFVGHYWADAKRYCNLLGSELYISESHIQNSLTWAAFLQHHPEGVGEYLWFGLKKGQWDSIEGNWNNVPHEDAAATKCLDFSSPGIITESYTCNINQRYICKKPLQ